MQNRWKNNKSTNGFEMDARSTVLSKKLRNRLTINHLNDIGVLRQVLR